MSFSSIKLQVHPATSTPRGARHHCLLAIHQLSWSMIPNTGYSSQCFWWFKSRTPCKVPFDSVSLRLTSELRSQGQHLVCVPDSCKATTHRTLSLSPWHSLAWNQFFLCKHVHPDTSQVSCWAVSQHPWWFHCGQSSTFSTFSLWWYHPRCGSAHQQWLAMTSVQQMVPPHHPIMGQLILSIKADEYSVWTGSKPRMAEWSGLDPTSSSLKILCVPSTQAHPMMSISSMYKAYKKGCIEDLETKKLT